MVVKSSQTSDGVKLTLFRQIPRQSARWLPARSVDTQNHPSFWFHFSRSQHHVDHVNNLCQSPCRRSSLLLLLRCSPLRTIVHTEPQHQDQLCRFIIDCVREAAGGCFCSTQPTASWSDNTEAGRLRQLGLLQSHVQIVSGRYARKFCKQLSLYCGRVSRGN